MRRFRWCVLASAMCVVFSGCAMFHDLQQHRLWRFNRGPAPSTNPFFSVSDPIPELGQAADSLDLSDNGDSSAPPSLSAE